MEQEPPNERQGFSFGSVFVEEIVSGPGYGCEQQGSGLSGELGAMERGRY